MLKKWGIVLLLLGLVIAGCSAKTEDNEEPKQTAKTNDKEEIENDKEEDTNNSVEAANSSSAFEAGMYKVGVDIPSGEYVLIAEERGYFSINSSSKSDSILQNDNFKGNSIITIEDGQYVTVKRAKMYPISEAPEIVPVNGELSDGKYIVGKHLPAGEYKIAPHSGQKGYFALYNGSSVSSKIIENDNFDGERYLTAENGQYLKISRASIKVDGKQDINSNLEENKITVKQENGITYWKGKTEIVSGHDWKALSKEEKEQIIQKTIEGIKSSTDVSVKRDNKEYLLMVELFFVNESNLNESIKSAIGAAVMLDVPK